MSNSVNRPKGWNPVSEQYNVYSWTSLEAITVLTTLGISSVSPSESFNFFVPYATSYRKDGLETKSRKRSTFAGCSLLRLICGGSICWPGSLRKACFLASSMLYFVRPGIKVNNSDFEWSQTKIKRVSSVWYTLNLPLHRALSVFQQVDYLACFHPFHYCTSQQPYWKDKWTAVA